MYIKIFNERRQLISEYRDNSETYCQMQFILGECSFFKVSKYIGVI